MTGAEYIEIVNKALADGVRAVVNSLERQGGVLTEEVARRIVRSNHLERMYYLLPDEADYKEYARLYCKYFKLYPDEDNMWDAVSDGLSGNIGEPVETSEEAEARAKASARMKELKDGAERWHKRLGLQGSITTWM